MMKLLFPEVVGMQTELAAAKEAVENGDGAGVLLAAEVSEGIAAASKKTLYIILAACFLVAGVTLAIPAKKSWKMAKYAVVGLCALILAVAAAMHMGYAAEADKWAAGVEEAKKQLAQNNNQVTA